MTAGIRIVKPVDVVDAPDLTITEYVDFTSVLPAISIAWSANAYQPRKESRGRGLHRLENNSRPQITCEC